MKGIPNGVNHEKKGNKRPYSDARLVSFSLVEVLFTQSALFSDHYPNISCSLVNKNISREWNKIE